MSTPLSRRVFLTRTAMLGCCAAASPLLTPVTFAAPPWDNRLVVIILRGAMDGLEVLRPYGDAHFADLRGRALGPAVGAQDGPIELDGFFALHPALGDLLPLWERKELSFAHAVSTPYRDKRSHFDGQDLLEAGLTGPGLGARDGWLNRLLQEMPGVETETAYTVGRDDMLLTRGAAPVANWSPDARLGISEQALKLAEHIMHDDPLFRDAMSEAFALANAGVDTAEPGLDADQMNADMMTTADTAMAEKERLKTYGAHQKLAEFAARKLRGASRIAAFSLSGWDTHAAQDRTILRPLGELSQTILTLRRELGPVWDQTAVVAVTEFGRTVRLNGSGGSDHGTAGAMLMAGGALKGGRVITDWPGLRSQDLYQDRDLMPTRDLRAHLAWLMRGLYGVSNDRLEQVVFPGLDMGPDPKLLS